MNSHFMEEGSWMAQNMKKYSVSPGVKECKLKPRWGNILYPPVWQKWTFPSVPGAGRRAEQWELPFALVRVKSMLAVLRAIWQSPVRTRVCTSSLLCTEKPTHETGDLHVPAPDHCCRDLGKACKGWCVHGMEFWTPKPSNSVCVMMDTPQR